jgi:hypothetical protein
LRPSLLLRAKKERAKKRGGKEKKRKKSRAGRAQVRFVLKRNLKK